MSICHFTLEKNLVDARSRARTFICIHHQYDVVMLILKRCDMFDNVSHKLRPEIDIVGTAVRVHPLLLCADHPGSDLGFSGTIAHSVTGDESDFCGTSPCESEPAPTKIVGPFAKKARRPLIPYRHCCTPGWYSTGQCSFAEDTAP